MITKSPAPPPAWSSAPLAEDSHAFSLDALRAREARHTAAPAQDAADSGVIDLDALRDAGSVGCADRAATARLMPETHEAETPAPAAPRWAVATVGMLGGAVVALAAMVGLGLHERTAAIQDPAPRPTMAAAAASVLPTPSEELAEPVDVAAPAPVEVAAPTPPPSEVAPTPVATPSKKAPRKTRRSSKAKRPSKPATPKASKPTPQPTSKPKAAPDGDVSVNCILDPASCDRGSTKKAPKAQPKAPTSSLPDKLSSTQIRKALTGPKARAKQCRDMHAAPAGTTVKVKLSIAGSGSVRSATPLAPHANGLGRCVADALSDASFEPFAKPAMGVVYSVRL